MLLLERGIRDISRVLVLAHNSVYSARSVEDATLHVYRMEGHRSFHDNLLILSSWRLYLVVFSMKNVISCENKMDTTVWMWMMQMLDTNNSTVEPVHTAELGAMAVSSRVLSVRSLLRLPCYKILLENPSGNLWPHIFSWILMTWVLWHWVPEFKSIWSFIQALLF